MQDNGETMALKGTIFDLDGVVVNAVPLHYKAWRKMFSEYNKKFNFKQYSLKVDGIPRSDGAKAMLPRLSQENLDKAASKKQEYFLKLLETEGITVYKGIIDLVNRLKEKQVKTAVISSSKNCEIILEKANIVDLFEIVITGNEVQKGKPHPDIFLMAAKKMGVELSECVVFEDAVLGIKAAKSANMKCVGVDRYRKPERLKEADLVVHDLNEIDITRLEALLFPQDNT